MATAQRYQPLWTEQLGVDSSSATSFTAAWYKFGVDSVTVWTKHLGLFALHKTSGVTAVTVPSAGYLAETGTVTLSTTDNVGASYTYTSYSASTCSVSGNVVTGVETTTPVSTCVIARNRLATSLYSQATGDGVTLAKFSKVSANVLKAQPLIAQMPVGYDTATLRVDSATVTMQANSLETDTRFTLTPLGMRTSGLPAFSLTAVDSATGTTQITTFLKPVKIELPTSDTTTAFPGYRTGASGAWTAFKPANETQTAAMADTSTATGYEVTANSFIIWTRHMTSFGIQDQQDTLVAASSAASITVGGATATLSTTGGSGSGAVSYSSNTESVCTVAGTTLTAVAAGTCKVEASKAGDNVYAGTSSAEISVTVNAAVPQNTGGGGVPAIVSTGSGSITGTATYDAGGTLKCEAPAYSQTATSVKFTWSGIATGSSTVTAAPWLVSITIPAKTDGTLVCDILATGMGSTASSQVSFKIDKPAAPAPTPTATPTPEPTPEPVVKAQYKIKCVKWNKKVAGPVIRYKTGNNPKCWAGYKQTSRTKVS